MIAWPGRLWKLRRLDAERRGLAIEAAAMLALARLWLHFRSFRDIARRLGNPSASAVGQSIALQPETVAIARRIAWAIGFAARRVPFDAACLPQAIAAKLMLSRRGLGCSVSFGVARAVPATADADLLRAHAWVDAGRVRVCGYPVDEDLVLVARFD